MKILSRIAGCAIILITGMAIVIDAVQVFGFLTTTFF